MYDFTFYGSYDAQTMFIGALDITGDVSLRDDSGGGSWFMVADGWKVWWGNMVVEAMVAAVMKMVEAMVVEAMVAAYGSG